MTECCARQRVRDDDRPPGRPLLRFAVERAVVAQPGSARPSVARRGRRSRPRSAPAPASVSRTRRGRAGRGGRAASGCAAGSRGRARSRGRGRPPRRCRPRRRGRAARSGRSPRRRPRRRRRPRAAARRRRPVICVPVIGAASVSMPTRARSARWSSGRGRAEQPVDAGRPEGDVAPARARPGAESTAPGATRRRPTRRRAASCGRRPSRASRNSWPFSKRRLASDRSA